MTDAALAGDVALQHCAQLLERGDPAASRLLQRCLAEPTRRSAAWTELGEVLLRFGKTDAALVCLARGAPSFAHAMRRGLLARDAGRLEAARVAFAEAVGLDRTSPRAWFLLGACAQDARDFGPAAKAYETVLALDPTVAEAAVNLGTVRQETGDLDGAKAAYARAVQTRLDTFGRVAQALATAPRGELWLDLGELRRVLAG